MIKIKVDTGDGRYEYLELLPNLSFEKTNQFYKFSEIEYGRSVSFNIPRTSTNEKVLQDTGQVYEYGQLMRREIPCRVQYGAIEKDGKLTIESANKENYSCTLYTEISLLLDWVNGRKLKEYGADWTVFWNYAHAHAANDQGLTSKVMDIIPYSSEVPQNYIAKDEWCWLPSINIGKAISLLLGKAQGVTGDYNTRTYDLFDEVPRNQRNLYWLVLNSNNGSGSHSVNFRMQNNIPIFPMGDLGELEFELYSAYNESFLNGQRYAWVCDKDIVITVPQNFPAGIMLCSVHKIKGNFHTWLNEDPLTWYVNLKNFWAASTHVPGNQTLLPGDRIRITAGTHFAFYALSDLYWSSDERMHVFSQNLQGGNYQLTLELEFKEDIPLMPSQSSQSNLYHFADNAPDMTLMDLCKMYGMLTNTVFTFEDHELRFLKDAGFHDVEITDCTYFSEVKRLVGDWAIDEKVCFDSDDYVEQPISTTYHIDNLAVDQNENEHKLNASEGFLRSHGSYFGDGIFIPPAKRLAIHDASVEYEDDNTTIKKIKLDMKKPVVASLQTGNVRTLKRISKLPDNPYYSDLCEFSTKVKAKWRMSIEDFIKLDHTYRFVYRGRKYIWLDAKWNNGIVECTLQSSDYTAVEEYYINVTYTNGGDAGTSGYAQLGDTYYIWARPSDGFTFDHWECNGVTVSGAGQDYSFTVDGDAEWHAVFLGDEVTITATPDPLAAGTCTGGGTYHCGEMCTVTAAPAGVQYRFVEWQENGQQVSTSASYTFLVTGDRDLVAVFETLEKYSVVATCSPQGVATVSGSGSYYDGTTCTVAVTTNQRAFAFLHWVDLDTNEVVSTSTSYTFVVHSDRNLQAVYYGGHTVTTSTSPVGAGNTYGDGFYNEGDQVTVGFTPDQRNFTFDHWEDGDNPGVSVSSNNPYTFTIHEDRWLVAKCTGSTPTFYVNCSVDPTGAGTVSGTGQYVAGETCTLTATPAEGYHFSYYNELYGIFNTTDNPYTFTVSQNIVATAYFAKNLYRITVLADPTSGGTVTGGSGAGYYQYGQSVTITATANTGYEFLGWYLNGSLVTTQSSYTFTVTETATYIARFSNTKYNIIATVSPSNAGTVNGVGSFYYGENCTLTAVPVHGYSFSHWEEGGLNAGTSNPYTFTVTGNRSLVAVMEALEKRSLAAFPIPEKAGTCVVQSAPFFDGDTAYFNAIPNTGSTFSHWSTSNTGSPIISTLNPYPQTVSGDLTLYGMFDWNTYTVNVSLSPTGHGSVTGSGTYTYGDGCTCVATLTDDYIVDRWEVDGVTMQNGGNTFTFAVSGNNSVVCYVVQGTFYTVGAVTNPRSLGTITGTGSYLAGTNCTLSIDVAQGYSFHHWEKDGNNIGTGTSVTFQVTGDTYVTAEGSQIQYYINAVSAPLNCGTFTGTGAYIYGSQVILRAIPNQGYVFDSWWENNVEISTSPEITFLATQDRTLYARFNALGQYTISTVSVPNAGGSVSGGGQYYSGSTCTLTATTSGKYYFDHWSTSIGGASVSTSNPYSFTVTGNRTLYATFYEYAYIISATVSPAGGGNVTGTGSYTVDSKCVLTATPSSGYLFDHWGDENGNIVGRNPQYTINQVERAETFTAVFNQLPDYTKFTSKANGSVVKISKIDNTLNPTFEYSLDGGRTWTTETVNIDHVLDNGESIMYRGNNPNGISSDNSNRATRFSITGTVEGSGKLISLIDPTCQATVMPQGAILSYLFSGCTGLVKSPLVPEAYDTPNLKYAFMAMFHGCTSLEEVEVSWTEWPDSGLYYANTTSFMANVAATGVFKCPGTCVPSYNAVPSTWTVVRTEPDYLGFIAEGMNSEVGIDHYSPTKNPTFEYSLDGGKTWTTETAGVTHTLNYQQTILYRGNNSQGISPDTNNSSQATVFHITGSVRSYGKVMSLIDKTCQTTTLPTGTTLAYLFSGCTGLIKSPTIPNSLDLANLDNAYYGMFYNCTSLNDITVEWTEWEQGGGYNFDYYNRCGSTPLPQSGTFKCPSQLPNISRDACTEYIPYQWTVVNI